MQVRTFLYLGQEIDRILNLIAYTDTGYPANPDTLERGSVGHEASLVCTRDGPDIEFDIQPDAAYPTNSDTQESGSVGHDVYLV